MSDIQIYTTDKMVTTVTGCSKVVRLADHEKQLATLREALETIVGSVGDNGTEARNRARQALEIDK